MKRIILALFSFSLIACDDIAQSTDFEGYRPDGSFVVGTNFHPYNMTEWTADFSDYPLADEEQYELTAEYTTVPVDEEFNRHVLLLSGNNHSADLFMFIKREVRGLEPYTRYNVKLSSFIWTNVGENCVGVGGTQGESVLIKGGATLIEPYQADYYMNVDIGLPSEGGADAYVLGDITEPSLDCSGERYAFKQFSQDSESDFMITTDHNGTAWVFLGADSGYEGVTKLYISSVTAVFTPITD